MRVVNFDILKGTPASLASSVNFAPIYLAQISKYSLQLIFTSSPVGTFKLQASNYPTQEIQSNGLLAESSFAIPESAWTDITGSDQAVSASGNHTWNVDSSSYNWVRMVWTATSGAGVLSTAYLHFKGA